MPNLLISGPAGAGKSQLAKDERLAASGPTVIADFQSIYAAITAAERDPVTGKYPVRSKADEGLLPITEYVRRVIITAAVIREIGVIATNSDGDTTRRKTLLAALGIGAKERVVDPGRDVVIERLKEPGELDISIECSNAVNRWYTRK